MICHTPSKRRPMLKLRVYPNLGPLMVYSRSTMTCSPPSLMPHDLNELMKICETCGSQTLSNGSALLIFRHPHICIDRR